MDDVYYIVDLVVGNQSIPVSIDTGSSDTWFIQEPLKCIPFNPSYYDPSCGFGKGFEGNLSGGRVENETFARSYTDGTFVVGTFGYEDVNLGGVKVKHQKLGVVDRAAWFGDRLTSGLLGLAYPMMTGLDDNVAAYDPIFTTMWKNNLSAPMFTLALSRHVPQNTRHTNMTAGKGRESYLAFGGVPPVDYDDSSWARTPIYQMQKVMDYWPDGHDGNGLYAIKAEAFHYGRGKGSNGTAFPVTKNTTQFPLMVDCGSTLTVLPVDLATQIYNSFDPPATLVPSQGLYYAPCNATVPTFGIQIGSRIFYMSPDDLLRQAARDPETNTLCRIGVTDRYSAPFVLGVSFLSNVVAVFDIGNTEMRFAARNKY
ncbi:acid protease [Thozetella sp. PMI_491]|nr:acid protease [Thozetella sp. PMI_491]